MEHSKKIKKSGLLNSVRKFIEARGLFHPGQRILIGVSGGPDSMALLTLLTELRPSWDLDLMVLYCHHGLRAAADQEEAFVRTWATQWGCRFFSQKLVVRDFQKARKLSLQEAARELRYQAFDDYIRQEGADRLALAHTADDQAEEVLISLIRGAGLGGLAGIPVAREMAVRPLLETYRADILRYLAFRQVSFQEDQSNKDLRYLRARVRHHLLPELRKYSPNILVQLNRTAGLLQADERYLQEKTRELSETLIAFNGTTASIQRSVLAGLPQALSSRLIQQALLKSTGGLRHIRASHILSILEVSKRGRERGYLVLPGERLVQWDGNWIIMSEQPPRSLAEVFFDYTIDRPGAMFLPETGDRLSFRKIRAGLTPFSFPEDKNSAWVDFDKVAWPLRVRNVRTGDRFQPLGLRGSKKVNRYFMDRKVPLAFRSHIPLVFSREEIVWIAGMEIGHSFRLGQKANRILEITFERGKDVK